MTSLTPQHRQDATAKEAFEEGLINGLLTLIPTTGLVYAGLQSKAFVQRTNWQSRTALAIMPALFVFAWTSEHKMSHRMREIAQETRHAADTVNWAQKQLTAPRDFDKNTTPYPENHLLIPLDRDSAPPLDIEAKLVRLYRESIAMSGVRIVPGDKLELHQQLANYTAANPMKVLAAFAVPAVATIYYGQTGAEHLSFSMKLLHTRVFGQFATIASLLSIMGFKEYMDKHGRFITEADAEERVQEMQRIRHALMMRLRQEREAVEEVNETIRQAHNADKKDGNVSAARKGKKQMIEHSDDHQEPVDQQEQIQIQKGQHQPEPHQLMHHRNPAQQEQHNELHKEHVQQKHQHQADQTRDAAQHDLENQQKHQQYLSSSSSHHELNELKQQGGGEIYRSMNQSTNQNPKTFNPSNTKQQPHLQNVEEVGPGQPESMIHG